MYTKTEYNVFDLPLTIECHSIQSLQNHQTSPHWHDDFEFMFIKEGEMDALINGIPLHIEKNDIIVIESNCVHYFEGIQNKDCVFYTYLLNKNIFSNVPSLLSEHMHLLDSTKEEHFFVMNKESPHHSDIQFIFQQIVAYSQDKDQISSLLVMAGIYECLALLIKAMKKEQDLKFSSSILSNDSFKKMIYFIQMNYANKISIEDLCFEAHISRRHCFDLFKRFFGKTPNEYLNEYRLNMAQNFLQDSSKPISQIAIDCGFTHQSHFTNHYKKYFGFTPLQYRKKIGRY